MKLNKRTIIIVILIALSGISVYYSLFKNLPVSKNIIKEITVAPGDSGGMGGNFCLNNDEIAKYEIKEKKRSSGDSEAVVKISIVGKGINASKYLFDIDNIWRLYHPIEVHKCGIYIIRMFNYEHTKTKQNSGYKDEIWRYDYKGDGKPLILLSEKPKEFISYFSPDFRIDSLERHVSLVKGYLGSPDYALVIKDLRTLEDAFVLPMTEIEKNKLEIVGDLGLEGWSQDSRYFWVDTQYGANELGFIRIDSQDWSYELLPAPENVLGGDALNLENGYITVHPGNVWFGITEITEEEKAKRRKEGIGTELYIHNLFTGERKFVVKTDEPLYFFKPKWISDNELEYELPNGEKKIYKINY